MCSEGECEQDHSRTVALANELRHLLTGTLAYELFKATPLFATLEHAIYEILRRYTGKDYP